MMKRIQNIEELIHSLLDFQAVRLCNEILNSYICNSRIANGVIFNITGMKKHNGMRPQDIVILLKIMTLENAEWYNADLARSLKISPSEITEALNRCRIAGLIDSKKRNVHKNALIEFLVYGLKYIFPVEPGALVKGVPTAHSASPIKDHISSKELYVWPYSKGSVRGQAIEPLYRTLPEIVSNDLLLYELLVITDALRIGRVRERKIAVEELKKRLSNEPKY